MQKTKIEYLTHTWNPLKMKCTPVSAGCSNCWALRFARRHAANPTFCKGVRDAFAGGPIWLDTKELVSPLQSRHSGGRIGVQFMSDLFHDAVDDNTILRIWQVMAAAPQHQFFVLTKRPSRMSALLGGWDMRALAGLLPPGLPEWPVPNIWVGVSVESDHVVKQRVYGVLTTPASPGHRWISAEPLIADIDLWPYLSLGISFVVVGAETGPGKRPCQSGWIASLRNQCKEAGVAFFGKVDSDGHEIAPREYPGLLGATFGEKLK